MSGRTAAIAGRELECAPVCPVSSIFALDDLPEKWSDFTAKNSAYYGR
jgi:ferredoxin